MSVPTSSLSDAAASTALSSPCSLYALRLLPGDLFLENLEAFCRANKLSAVSIVTVVGSLTRASLRFANKPTATVLEGHFEIVSCVGTLSSESSHVHMSISDGDGRVIGGHVMTGCKVYTTAEVVLAEATALEYARAPCSVSTYDEFKVVAR
jgi:predicted DNA-binding protein with PD1-like motif